MQTELFMKKDNKYFALLSNETCRKQAYACGWKVISSEGDPNADLLSEHSS